MNDSGTFQVSEVLIRGIERRDAEAVAALTEQLGYKRSASEITDWIEGLTDRARTQAAFVACIADEVVGWIEVSVQHHLQSAPHALIGGLVVKDGYRNRQIGLRLCERVERWTWEQGLEVMRVTSRSTRLDAHRFYERNGYALTKLSHVYEKQRPE
ncbi:GNAT family N-acetyltransferase [Occallatibacter savannae]|uniref:GNAT family N-acetyltransferase n=1 Tax=Occallatibacter savannae TaxID=1002691 RepID=UPI000D68AAEC|nr:GNAT family N-acetyltransferase [Occallatibacter savannae]